MDFMGFDFTPQGVITALAGAMAAGMALGAVGALLASVVARR